MIGNRHHENMKPKRHGFIAVCSAIILCAIVYSFIPLIPFWLMAPAGPSDNNQANIKKLESNKGAYFSFIVFGDNHAGLILNDAATLKEIWHMNREDRFRKVPIDFVLSVGDVSLDGEPAHFRAYKKMQKLIKFPVVAAIGNHDPRELFEENCGIREFGFVNRNSYFIIVDNEAGEVTETQFAWLEDRLKEGQHYDNIFIAMHKPPFDPCQQEWYNMDNMPWAYRFRKLCAQYKVRMVFCGHKHMFKHERFDGVDYIVTGGGGMVTEIPESEGGFLHYIRVMVNHDYVTYEVRRVSAPLWEYPAYYFWKEAIYWARNLYGSGYIFGRNTKTEPIRVQNLNDKEYWFYGPRK
ncbi:MAG: metallophosphoesterase [Candidatus Omnitrophica bacterium]|nr:metallophosphoesterase [Candidatus Omnitrophota bacterium]